MLAQGRPLGRPWAWGRAGINLVEVASRSRVPIASGVRTRLLGVRRLGAVFRADSTSPRLESMLDPTDRCRGRQQWATRWNPAGIHRPQLTN